MRDDKPQKISRNAAKCLECDTVVESKHRHDFVTCKCGALSVDGGRDYLRRVFKSGTNIQELVAYE